MSVFRDEKMLDMRFRNIRRRLIKRAQSYRLTPFVHVEPQPPAVSAVVFHLR